MHHSSGGDAPSSAVKLHFLSGVRTVEDTVLWTLRLESLEKAMEVLDHQSRELIDFRYARGLTMEEIRKFYGVSKMAVSKRLKKLHEKLKGSVI